MSGIPRASVYRLMSQLCDVGAVELVGDRYVIGRTMLALATRAEPVRGLRRRALPLMQALRERTGATVSLVSRRTDDAMVLEALPGREPLPVDIYAGLPLPDLAAATLILTSAVVSGRIDPVRRTAVDLGHTVAGMQCLAAALTLPNGDEAAVQITTTHRADAADLLPLVRDTGRRIGSALRATT